MLKRVEQISNLVAVNHALKTYKRRKKKQENENYFKLHNYEIFLKRKSTQVLKIIKKLLWILRSSNRSTGRLIDYIDKNDITVCKKFCVNDMTKNRRKIISYPQIYSEHWRKDLISCHIYYSKWMLITIKIINSVKECWEKRDE